MHYELCIMNCFRAFRLSPSGFPLYLCSPCFRLASPIPFSVPKSRSRSPYPNPAPLAKDAAPIPNALEATGIELRAMSKITPNS